jgi:phytoene/squalene synthetase
VVVVNPDSHSARYFALLYAAHAERPALEALFGIEREVLDSVRPGLDHHVAHSRLQWWREECERAARGGAAHPLTRALITALGDPQAKSVPQLAGLCGIVDVATWDLASATFETRRELDAYCQRWAVAMIEPLVAAATYPTASTFASSSTDPPASAGADAALSTRTARSPAAAAVSARTARSPAAAAVSARTARSPAADTISTRQESSGASTGSTGSANSAASAALLASAERTAVWQDLGAAICEIELLAGLALDANEGRIRVPLDELESANVDTRSLNKLPWPETAAALIRGRLTFLRSEIERSVAGSNREQQQPLRGLLVWAALSWRAAHRMERALPNRPQPGRFDGFSDAWFAWRIARQATVGRFRLN